MELNVSAINTPRKSFLLPPVEQARALARLYRKNRVSVSVQPETYTALAAALRDRRRWGVVEGRPNTDLPHFEVATAIVYDKLRYKVVDVHNIHFAFPGRPKTGLNVPVVLLRNRVTGYIFAVIGVHIPTRSAASDQYRDQMNKTIAAYAQQLTVPVVIAGDFNNAFVVHYYERGEFVKTHKERKTVVDGILVKGLKIVGAVEITEGIHNIITDHHQMLLARLETRIQRKEDKQRVLPKS